MKHATTLAFVSLVVMLATSVLVVSPPVKGATTVTFTSTADFDAGTKSQPSPADGNYQVDTSSDNLGTATGAFELASLKGDSFTLADTDADTFKWNLITRAGMCSGVNVLRSIASGVLSVSVVAPSVVCQAGVITSSTISGDWDMRIYIDKIDVGSGIVITSILNEVVAYCSDSATADGVMYYWPSSNNAEAYTCVNGAFTLVGTSTPIAEPQYLRMTKVGTTFTWYYSSDGSTWTQDETTTNIGISGSFYFIPTIFSDGATPTASSNYDAFYLASGTVDANGFRGSGSWTSATQTYAGEVVALIDVTYSGVSATNYIDAISVRDSAGNALYTDNTDRTSGTSAIVSVPHSGDLEQDWAIRIALAGGNAGTPTVESAVVTTDIPPGESGAGSPDLKASCTYAIGLLRCRDLTDYTGYRNMDRVDWWALVYISGQVYVLRPFAFIGSTEPGDELITRLSLPDYMQRDGTISVLMILWFAGGGHPSRSFTVPYDNLPTWIFAALVSSLLVAFAAAAISHAVRGTIYFEPATNPSYKHLPSEEYPSGWHSYRVRPPERYTRFRSRRSGERWIVFGIRPTTSGERSRTGRKYIAEVQTVRERIR